MMCPPLKPNKRLWCSDPNGYVRHIFMNLSVIECILGLLGLSASLIYLRRFGILATKLSQSALIKWSLVSTLLGSHMAFFNDQMPGLVNKS